ncbi:COX assembly mitochondrial protein [Sergentomyia squamirostris]
MNVQEEGHVPRRFTSGPHNLGDPDDKSLRKVEIDVLIPKIMRDRARAEKCISEVMDFEKCCKDSGVLMVVKCRRENNTLKGCLTKWYEDEAFKSECRKIYLEERTEFRRTGVSKKRREQQH